jgi:hypothetical protein
VNEGINFHYLAGGDSIESKPRPEKKVCHGLFVSIQTKLNENWDGKIKIEISPVRRDLNESKNQ